MILYFFISVLWWIGFLHTIGDILGVTKLQGAVIYSYKDLKSATNNFSVEYKVGEGGFGDVYKASSVSHLPK